MAGSQDSLHHQAASVRGPEEPLSTASRREDLFGLGAIGIGNPEASFVQVGYAPARRGNQAREANPLEAASIGLRP